MKRLNNLTIIILVIGSIFLFAGFRQLSSDIYPEYTIEAGDFLSVVAARFQTTVEEIISLNQISNPDNIAVGDIIKIPSLKGYSGKLRPVSLNIGDTITSISILHGMPVTDLLRINQITSYSELYIGSTLLLIEDPNIKNYTVTDVIETGETYLEKAVKNQVNPQVLTKVNQVQGSWDITEKQAVYSPLSETHNAKAHLISPLLDSIEIGKMPLMQGETGIVHVVSSLPLELSGNVLGQSLIFHQEPDNTQDRYALFAIDAEQEIGATDFYIKGTAPDQGSFEISQKLLIQPGIFTYEIVSGVDPSTIEDHSMSQDQQALAGINQSSPVRTWGDRMSYPVDEPCIVSAFGNRRTYNGGEYKNFHSGVDFGVCYANNVNIYAAADGTVLFAGDLPIHGMHTIIDHGWGVYSTYSHQSQILINPGQEVKRGDLIGLIGNTGRSVGPHLHWEIKVNGIYVNPMSWLNNKYP